MQFRVLGPLSIWDSDRPIAIPTAMVRRLLALLLSSAGRPISADALAEELWHGEPPRSARKTLQVYMHRLRRLFGDHSRVTYDMAGYTLRVAPHELDASVFADLFAEAVQARELGDLEAAHSLLERAHELWHGDAYAGFQDMALIAAEADRLREAKLTALEEHFAIGLDLGRHATLVGELSVVVANNPYRERLRGQLMVALYRGGRQAEALQAYRQGRELLVADLGVEPIPELQLLHRRILANDPELAAPALVKEATAHHYLTRDVPGFTGRTGDLRWLDEAAANRDAAIVINAIAGTAGVGKTALALRWAHSAMDRFPDGQLYVNLRGHDHAVPVSPLDALTHLLRCLGVPPDQLPVDIDEASARYRSLVHGKRLLILLDNARTAEQVRPLLPGEGACLVVVTSRDSLSGLIARDGAKRLTLGVLGETEAIELLGKVIGAPRVSSEQQAACELVRLCAGLPLALRIAAVQLVDRPELRIADYVADLARGSLIDRLAIEGDEHYAVRAVLDRSYDALGVAAQRFFAALGANPGPDFTPRTAAVLADLPIAETVSILDSLAGSHLVEEPVPGRFTFHDLVRDYARSRPAPSGALDRLLGYFHAVAAKASSFITTVNPVGPPPEPGAFPALSSAADAMAWLETERANLVAAVSSAAATGRPDLAAGIANHLWHFFHFAGHTSDWITTFERALAAVEPTGDEATRCTILNALGNAYVKAGRYGLAIKAHQDTVASRERSGDLVGAAKSRRNLAISYERQGRYAEAIIELEIALQTFRDNGEKLMEAMILGSGLSGIQNNIGQSERARDGLLQALALLREVGTAPEFVVVLSNLGETYQLLGDPVTALSYLDEALELARSVGDRHGEALVLGSSADAHRQLADYDRAIELRKQAHELIGEVGMRGDVCGSLNQLAAAYCDVEQFTLARTSYEQALEIATELGETHQEARALAGLGTLLLQDDPPNARELLTRALRLFEPISQPDTSRVREQLAQLPG